MPQEVINMVITLLDDTLTDTSLVFTSCLSSFILCILWSWTILCPVSKHKELWNKKAE